MPYDDPGVPGAVAILNVVIVNAGAVGAYLVHDLLEGVASFVLGMFAAAIVAGVRFDSRADAEEEAQAAKQCG